MSEINYPPMKEAMDRIKDMSGDMLAWHEATRRTIAVMDEKQYRLEARKEVLAEGRAEGVTAGQARMLERLLSCRFGPLSPTQLDRLHHATESELQLWADRVLAAPTIQAVLAP